MKKSYRLNQEALYAAALKTVRVTVRKVTVHLDASATVKGDERVEKAIRRIEGVEVKSVGGGEITFRVPAAAQYDAANPPRFTEAEKAAEAAAKAERKAERASKQDAANAATLEEDAAAEETDADDTDEDASE